MPRRHIVPDKTGGWRSKNPGASTPGRRYDTQAEAEAAGREQLRREGGGELVTHRPDGRIRDSDTVPHANDPNPPRDQH